MRLKYQSDNFVVHTVAPKSAKFHLILLENRAELPDFTDPKDQTAQLFHNLRTDLDQWTGTSLALTVVTATDAYVAKGNPIPTIYKLLKRIKSGFSQQNEGVMIVSNEIAARVHIKPYKFLNVVIPKSESIKGKNLGLSLPIPETDKRNWMISIPSFLWSRVGKSVRGDDSGINLLGYIYRGCKALIEGQTEISIYNQMRAWHAGKFGETVFIDTISKFKKFIKKWKLSDIASIDSEGTSLKRVDNTILSLQFVLANGHPPKIDLNFTSWFLPLEHDDTPWTAKELKYIRKVLRYMFERACHQQTHVYQFAKFDIHQLMSLCDLRNYSAAVYDVSAGSFTLEENQKMLRMINVRAYQLEHMESNAEYLRPKDLVIAKSDRSRMAEFSLEDICTYGVLDVVTPYFLMCEQVRTAQDRGYPNFYKFVTHQIGRMLYAMTVMEHNGIEIDTEYLESIASPVGPLADQIREVAEKIKTTTEATQANKILLRDKPGFQNKGLFGSVANTQVWDIRKKAHLAVLFFDACKLEPLAYQKTKEGNIPIGKLDAKFQKLYRHHPVVKMFTEYQKLSKLKSAFADSIHEYLRDDKDMKVDKRLRPVFTYLDVLTGRSSTVRPSTQQIPMHGKLAKIIKRQFKVRKGRVLGKTDYAAHEVRVSGNLSKDEAILETVDKINDLTWRFRIAVGPNIEKTGAKLKTDGDIHVLNYYTFFEVRITKDDPRRQDAKVAIFSVTYGAKAGSVARKMLEEALVSAEDKLINPETPEEEKRKLKKVVAYLKSEQAAEDYYEKAVQLLDVLEHKWAGLTGHIEDLCAEVRIEHVLFGPHGRPRHLWGHISPDKFAGFAMDRRAFNSKGQGFASDFGYVAIYLFNSVKWKIFDSQRYKTDILTVNAVHDSAMNDMAFQFFPIYTYMQEHAMTSLAQKYYKKHFNITTHSNYGFDLEAGAHEAELIGWNKRPADLPEYVRKLGDMTQASKAQVKSALEDAKIIGDLRLTELNDNTKGYTMRLLDESWQEKILPQLTCFNV